MDRAGALIGRSREVATLSAALADRSTATVLITGAEGVGKTALMRSVVESFADSTIRVGWVSGDGSTSTIPFGAFAHLLPSSWTVGDGALNLIRSACDALLAEIGADHFVLGIDDAPLLDTNSAALVRYLVVNEIAKAVITATSSAVLPPALAVLVETPSTTQFELLPLDRAGTRDLIESLLDGPLDPDLVRRGWELSQGNPMLVREMALRGRDIGVVTFTDDRWQIVGGVGRVPHLRELVGRRIDHLNASERDVLEVLTVVQPLGLTTLETLCDAECIDLAEQHELITYEHDGRRLNVRLAHPLYGEVVRTTMSPRRTRSWERRVADSLRATGRRRRDDDLREALLRLNAGLEADPSTFIDAGRQSLERFEFLLAERFARAAHTIDPSVDSALLVGEALLGQHRHPEAEAAMFEAERRATDDGQRVSIAATRAYQSFWGRDDAATALAVLTEAAQTVHDTGALDDLDAHRASVELFSGATAHALARSERVAERKAAAPFALVLADGIAASAYLHTGQITEAISINKRAIDRLDLVDHRSYLLARRSLSQVNGWAALYSGDVPGAVTAMQHEYEASNPTLWPRGPAAFFLGNAYRWAGDITTAIRFLEEGVEALTIVNLRRHLTGCLAELAHCYALQGDVERSRDTLARSEANLLRSMRYGDTYSGQARTWCAAITGDLTAAIELAWQSSRRLAAIDHLLEQAVALHDIVRLGNAHRVTAELQSIAARVDSAAVATMARHARAASDRDALGLFVAAGEFEFYGMVALAAECFEAAVISYRRDGDIDAAQRASTKADAMRLRTSARPWTRAEAGPVTLTAREHAVAVLAARGVASADIAAQLTISIRTVNNHLQHVYAKLGVHSRDELAVALTGSPTPTSGR